jgi:hypothetical protein
MSITTTNDNKKQSLYSSNKYIMDALKANNKYIMDTLKTNKPFVGIDTIFVSNNIHELIKKDEIPEKIKELVKANITPINIRTSEVLDDDNIIVVSDDYIKNKYNLLMKFESSN